MIEYKLITQKYKRAFDKKLNGEKNYKYTQQKGSQDVTIYSWKPNKKERESALEYITHLLSELVQEEVLKSCARKYLKTCISLSKEEKKRITEIFITNNYLKKEDGASALSYYLVYVPIKHMLEDYQSINIEGWINFRTQRYYVLLEDILEQLVNDFNTQKDYAAVLELLIESKYLVEDPVDSLQLKPDQFGEIRLINEKDEDVTEKYIEEHCSDLLDEEIEKQDLLMHILINVAPNILYIHHVKRFTNSQFIETVGKVFEGHVVYCEDYEDIKINEQDKKY